MTHTGRLVECVLAVAIMLAGAGVAGCSNEKAGKAASDSRDDAIPVIVMKVQASSLQRTINAVGTVRYRRETPLGFTTAGRVASVRYNEGDYVKRGAVLASLDRQNVGADLAVAQAERDRAQADFERLRGLYNDGWVTKKQFEASDAAAKAAAARVRQADYARGTSQIIAPSSGVILTRNVEPGQVIPAGTPALTIGEAGEGFVFRVPVIDREASKLRVGMSAMISIESLGGDPIEATISEIDGRANEATGAFTVIFRLSAQSRLRSGQIGTAEITLPAAEDGSLQIPASALFGVRTGEGLVFVVNPKDNRIETRNVSVERVMDDAVIITGGVGPGDVIVTRGGEKLRTGSKVRAVAAPG